ncbi:MAG: hypothetical protein PWP04_143 [Candidatus Atribacteria bacterium]|nr:hypothetical protein [Candidatus Atribacteria bacterium]
MLLFEKGSADINFTPEEIEESLQEAAERLELGGKKVLVIVPDATRTAPMKTIFSTLQRYVRPKAQKLDFLIALGTHPPMRDEEIKNHLGVTPQEAEAMGISIFNHSWDDPKTLRTIGTISPQEMKEISNGLLEEEIPVSVNHRIFDYQELLIVGPVFPHEVVGFSGGYKYLFPGISGGEITNRYHWLAALITNPKIIGHKYTPTREVLNRAARFIPIPISAICFVMQGEAMSGLFAGDVVEAWSKAADLSAQVNITYVEKPFHTVISIAPPMYNELWVGGKCMYKLEPIVADGGTVIIYAPQIKEISVTHGRYLQEIGYHTRDFFLAQWDKYQSYPGGVLAHSTHVKGIGKFLNGREYPRVEVVLATGIPKEICQKINLGYMDYKKINLEEYQNREEEGILVVPRAGEVLYRLADGSFPDIDKLEFSQLVH